MATDASPAPPFVQALMTPRPRKQRKETFYTKEERAIMGKYKDDFKTTRGKERDHIVRGKILVDLFNFWHNKGIGLREDEMETRVTV